VGEGEVCGLEILLGTALEFLLQGAVVHIFDQIIWPVADLDVEFLGTMAWGTLFDAGNGSCRGESEKNGRGNKRAHNDESSRMTTSGDIQRRSIEEALSFNGPETWETKLFLQGRHHARRDASYLQMGCHGVQSSLRERSSAVPLVQ
jgi:hypothetical protein